MKSSKQSPRTDPGSWLFPKLPQPQSLRKPSQDRGPRGVPLITGEMGDWVWPQRELGFSMCSQRLLLSGVPTPPPGQSWLSGSGHGGLGEPEPGCWLHLRSRAHQLQPSVLPRWSLQLCQVVIKLPGVLFKVLSTWLFIKCCFWGMDQKLKRSWGVGMVLLQPPRANSKTSAVRMSSSF